MQDFQSIKPEEWGANPFAAIGKQWMLITAGNRDKYNTMTASWGGVGVLWNKNVVFSFVRPQRYTMEFLEREEYFTLSFYGEEYRDALKLCGAKSGRDVDKAKVTGLTPVFDREAPYFEQARAVLVCRKLYGQWMDPACFLDKELDANYANHDYHKIFVGEIVTLLTKE